MSRDLYYEEILLKCWWRWSRSKHSVFRKENTCAL